MTIAQSIDHRTTEAAARLAELRILHRLARRGRVPADLTTAPTNDLLRRADRASLDGPLPEAAIFTLELNHRCTAGARRVSR